MANKNPLILKAGVPSEISTDTLYSPQGMNVGAGKTYDVNGTPHTHTTSATWGSIGGTLSSQTDLNSALGGKSDTSHNHSGVYEPAFTNLSYSKLPTGTGTWATGTGVLDISGGGINITSSYLQSKTMTIKSDVNVAAYLEIFQTNTKVWGVGIPASTTRFGIFDSGIGGSERFTILAGGNVGIWDTAPTSTLSIAQATRTGPGTHPTGLSLYVTGGMGYGNTTAAGNIEFRHSNGTAGVGFGYYGMYQTCTGAPLTLSTDNVVRLTVASGGNVGIGTTAPSTKLDVYDASGAGGATVDVLTLSSYPSSAGNGNAAGILFKTRINGPANVAIARIYSPLTDGSTSPNEAGNLVFQTKTAGTANLTDKMTILGNGNVGIGTTTPNALLSLGSGIGSKFLLYDGGSIAAGGNGYFAGLAIDKPAANGTMVLAHHAGYLAFGRYTNINDTGNVTTWMTITNDGKVGVGCSPSSKLHVSGGDSSFALFGPNTTWGAYLKVGSGPVSAASGVAMVSSSNGNLHLDSGAGQLTYINWISQAETNFGNNVLINGSNQPLVINATTSESYKVTLKDNGTIRGYWGAAASYPLCVYSSGGINVFRVTDDGYVTANGYAEYTPYPETTAIAYDAIKSLERLPAGRYKKNDKKMQVNHDKLHQYLKAGKDGDGRDMSATISCLAEVTKDLIKRIETLEGKL